MQVMRADAAGIDIGATKTFARYRRIAFRSTSAFASWMGLCPNDEIGGGKVLWVGTRKANRRAATALRIAAQSPHHSKSALGDFYRRLRAKLGAPKAITAAAHKSARIIFHLVATHPGFDDSRFAANQLRFHKHQVTKFRAKARALGFQLVSERELSGESCHKPAFWFAELKRFQSGAGEQTWAHCME
jgi:hypothetical protein